MNLIQKLGKHPYLKLAYVALALLTLAGTVLRSAAFSLSFNAESGYFGSGTSIISAYVLQALALLLCAAFPFLIKKGALCARQKPLSIGGLFGAGLSALVFVILAVYLVAKSFPLDNTSSAYVRLAGKIFVALLLLLGAAYLCNQFRTAPELTTVLPLGIGATFAPAGLLALTYFDLTTTMNSPHKVSLQLCFLAIMVATLQELRLPLERPQPRARAAVYGVAFHLCFTTGVSNTVAFLTGRYDNVLYLLCDLLCLALSVYFGAKCVDVCLLEHFGKEDVAV